ncbi:conserved Large extracellular alpha-helical protein of unknown function [Magnetospirillum gryphiswaldense MSR-1 v2]|uniref:Alpha-2-macroglobulin n=1 Tax=Magnetospirillum gryphiswaldense (strain DSM 6361 / JCM 21280 / NBRC 15271 / MSR-1) TaxID=431944 RepID=V6F5M8_MAGGM|nr:alpha-2-macroglobulin [Magnetospirillum gryphiswaldense]CDL00754.1 conserved Large extracellular alpha-helical protein of unknown function [Magnetospirillum gryphiswaldense MSR-1 v2]
MQRGLAFIAVSIVAGAAALGAWGTHDLRPAVQPVVAAIEAPPPRSGDVAPLASVNPGLDQVKPSPGVLTYQRLITNAESDTPEACLVFSAPLDPGIAYQDYLTIPTQPRPGLRVDQARLCVSGLAFGREHAVTMKAGLPAADGSKLAADTKLSVSFGDRPPQVAFGPGFILPRHSGDGLPVTTVNAPRLEMKLYRVGDRLLARMRQDLVDEKTVYPYQAGEYADDEGRLVWSGGMDIKGERNESTISLFPLAQAMGKPEPGAYLLVAALPKVGKEDVSDEYDYRPIAGQWVVHSDLGLTSFRGDDGLTVSVRSLGSAKAKPGVRLTLIARNNDELAQAVTDAEGRVHFAPGLLRGQGGMAPVMVMAYDGDDFNFLDLRRPDFDLSDRGDQGRDPAGPVDAFLYTERGIYRPGESIELVTLLRDPDVRAIANATPILSVLRPDGREYRRFTAADRGAGSYHLTIPLPKSANRGLWRINALMDPKGEPVGTVQIDVQDFVPQRLALDIAAPPALLRPGQDIALDVAGRFLYGAPAAHLGGEAELTLEADPNPFPQHKGFVWGVDGGKYAGERVTLKLADTDEAGKTRVTGALPARMDSPVPVRAVLNVALREPGGRTTSDQVMAPVALGPLALGLRPHFDGVAPQNQDSVFDVLAVDETGKPVATDQVEYRLFRDVSTWQWYRANGEWRYQRVAKESQIAGGTLTVGADKPAQVRQTLSWGSYRLEMRKQGVLTSKAFYVGWYGQASADRPDRLKVGADRPGYAPGDKARVRVETDQGGEALLVIANERVQHVQSVTLAPGGGEIAVEMKPEWGPGAYALVTLYRPLTDKVSHAPVRAVGTVWLGLDPARRTLAVTLEAPDKIIPRQRLTVPVKVSGGDQAFVTLAAVDQGILQLTRFKTPSPTGHYLVQRRLGVGMRDDYGRLIRGLPGQGDDQGGDAMGRGLDVVPTRTVALFSGVVPVKDGIASIELDIPDFQGELRLMAVAFDGTKLGSTERRLTVRDPVVAEMILPRFLAPGDRAAATVLLHNLSGAAGDFRLDLTSDGPVHLAEQRTETLAAGERRILSLPIRADQPGIANLGLIVSGPDNFAVSRTWPIQVRPAQAPVSVQNTVSLAAGAQEKLDGQILDAYLPGSAQVSLSLSRWQGLDVPGMLRWLDRYPYGCLEQTTSRALPLLYFNDLAAMAGTAQDANADARIQQAVDRVLTMQGVDGSFRMWGPWGDDANAWLSAFALDFLDRAAAKGFDVPEAPRALGRRWLAADAFTDSRPEVKAYAAFLLARAGKANASDLRYFFDSAPPKGAMAWAHLGAALDSVGERARAALAFDRARQALNSNPSGYKPLPYGSYVRDVFAVAAIMAEAGRSAQIPDLLAMGFQQNVQAEQTTTQDKAWILMAAAALGKNAGQVAVQVDGKAVGKGDPVAMALDVAALTRGVSIDNTGSGAIFRTLSVDGIPAQEVPAQENGVGLSKQVFSLDGQPVDLAQVKRNDRLVVVLEMNAHGKRAGDYALLDLLPAGLEAEGVIKADQPGYPWLSGITDPSMRELGDDRFIAVQTLPRYVRGPDQPEWEQGNPVHTVKLAYVVRAVGLGEFAMPAALAEHMYAPGITARTAMGRLGIVE